MTFGSRFQPRLGRFFSSALFCMLSLPVAAQRAADPAVVELHRALSEAGAGDAVQALSVAQHLTATHPTFAPGWKLRGSLLEDAGKASEAEQSYERGLQLAPKDPDLLYKVGLHRLQHGDASSAAMLERASILTPRDPDTFFYLAQAFHLAGDDEKALKAIRRCIALDPKSALAVQKIGELLSGSGDSTEGLQQLMRAAQMDPSLDRIDFDLAYANLREENLDAAGTYIERARQRHPDDESTLRLSAEIDAKLSKWSDAEEAFSALAAKHPDDAETLLGLGHCELELKQYEASIRTLQHLLNLAPTTILAHFYLARDYAALGRPADAAHENELHNELVQRAGSLTPEDERRVERATLIEARQLLSQGKEKAALELFRTHSKGPTATPGAPYMLIGVSYLYMGRLDDSRRCLERALAIEPGVRLAQTYLGVIALRANDLAGAEKDFDDELKRDPRSQLAIAELGEVRYQQGRWAEAASQLTKSRTVDPRLLYLLSDAYFELGNLHDADSTAELAMSYAHDDPEARTQILALLRSKHRDELASRLDH